jgi:hypothetical protein
MGNDARVNRRDEIEAWWALIARILSFIVGVTILLGQAFFVTNPAVAVTVAGIGLCGPYVAASVATVFVSMRGDAAPAIESPE